MEKERGITIINVDDKKQCDINVVVSRLVCPNNEQHIVKKEGVGKYCMVCGLLK